MATINFNTLVNLIKKYNGFNNYRIDWEHAPFNKIEGSDYFCEKSLESNYKNRGETSVWFATEKARDEFVAELTKISPDCEARVYYDINKNPRVAFRCSDEGMEKWYDDFRNEVIAHNCH